MSTLQEPNGRLPSTTWSYKRVKMRSVPKASGTVARRASTVPSVSKRNPREPLTITVRYRGGAEAWWEIRARGQVWRRPGWIALHDVMREINGDDEPR